jgi:phospholipase/carboxylesterase
MHPEAVGAPRPASIGRLDSRPSPEARPSSLPAGSRPLDLGPGTEAVLVVPADASGPLPLLVFLHWAGGSAAHSLALVGAATAAAGCLLLAPTSVASTWDLIAGGLGRDVAVLDAALERTFAAAPVSRVAVGGFSDGASYALSIGLANGDLFDTVLAFSPGFAAPPTQRGHPRVWISHGTGDRVLPVERCGRRVSRALTGAGYDVVYEEFDGGHVVPPRLVTRALGTWLG